MGSAGSPRARWMALLVLLAAGACGRDGPAPSDGWGPVREGLRTRLVLASGAPAVGSPVRVRLDLENVGTQPRTIDAQQVAVNGSLEVTGPDGLTLPYRDASYQTVGEPQVIAPGETATLAKGLDVARQYLLVAAGRYRIRFRGSTAGFGSTEIPASGVLDVVLAEGPLPWDRRVLSVLERARPEGWTLFESASDDAVQPRGHEPGKGASFTFTRPAPLKRDVLSLTVHVLEAPAAPRADAAGEPGAAEPWGRLPVGHVYVEASDGVAAAWPGYKDDVGKALAAAR